MATGLGNGGVPVTAWKWRCCLCGREFDEITLAGVRQLCEGKAPCDVFQWMTK